MSTQPTGWITYEERTPEQNNVHGDILAAMPKFAIKGVTKNDAKKIVLNLVWSHPMVVKDLGFVFKRIHQATGSCVGAGGGNALFTVMASEVIRLGDPELICVPGWLYTYGKSRQRAGMRGRGDGSMGSTWAEAIVKDGIVDATEQGMPEFENADGLEWSSSDEYRWSDGAAAPAHIVEEAKKHIIKSAAPINSVEEMEAAIRNGYPLTWACSRNVGSASIRGSKFPTVVGTFNGRGGHQTSIQGLWEHPELGLMFKNQNNWPKSSYPQDPDKDATECANWHPADDFKAYFRSGDAECYALSQFDGFPAQEISWNV